MFETHIGPSNSVMLTLYGQFFFLTKVEIDVIIFKHSIQMKAFLCCKLEWLLFKQFTCVLKVFDWNISWQNNWSFFLYQWAVRTDKIKADNYVEKFSRNLTHKCVPISLSLSSLYILIFTLNLKSSLIPIRNIEHFEKLMKPEKKSQLGKTYVSPI